MTAVPTTLAHVTTSWLSAALAPAHGPVAAVTLQRIGTGTGFASQVGLATPTYAGGGGPKSLVVKLAEGTREADFYRHVGDYAGPRVPHCHFADHDGERSALVLEDLSAARFGDDAVGCSVEDAGLVVDALATLHSRWWGSPRLDDFAWLGPGGQHLDQRLAELPDRLATMGRRYGEADAPEVFRILSGIGPEHAPLLSRLAGPPTTLLHVDAHLDNVAFLDGEAVLFDWQGAGRGLAAVDLSHAVVSALRGDTWRALPELVGRYHARLEAGGVAGYPRARLEEDLQVGALRWLMGVVGWLGRPDAGEMTGRKASLAGAAPARWNAAARELALAELV